MNSHLLLNMPERAVRGLAPVPVPTKRHLLQVELVQELAPLPLHAQPLHPVPANYGAEAGVVLGGYGAVSEDLAVAVCVGEGGAIVVEEDAPCLFVGEGILELWDCLWRSGGREEDEDVGYVFVLFVFIG
jgi:hypothetical protein